MRAQLCSKDDLAPPPSCAFVDNAMWNLHAQHLFQTQRLRAKLNIGVCAMASSQLILDRNWHARVPLYRIGLAAQPVALRPERNSAISCRATIRCFITAIDTRMHQLALDRVHILVEGLLNMDQGTLARAVAVVLQR